MKKWIAAGALAFVVVADQPVVYGQDFVDENGNGINDAEEIRHRFGRRAMFGAVSQLTAEQKEALRAQIQTLRKSDATRDEIRAAISSTLERFGVDLAEAGDRIASRFGDQLTQDQIAALTTEIEVLRASGASREEVRATVSTTLKGFGVELPDLSDRLGARFGDALTEDQIGELTVTIESLRDAGASRAEVRAAVDAQLEALGVERPARRGRKDLRGRRFGRWFGGRPGGPAPPAEATTEDAN